MSHDNLSFLDEFLHVVITGDILISTLTIYGDVLLSEIIFLISAVLLPAALRAAQTCRYFVYSEANFEVFSPRRGDTLHRWG